MNIFAELAEKIILKQEGIIGPVALEQARKVEGLQVDWSAHSIVFSGDEKVILNKLVEQYKNFFGQASIEVCKEAVKEYIGNVPTDQIPDLLR